MILERRYRLGPRAVTSARRALEALADDLPASVLEDLRLLVSELVGNSVRHARAGPEASVLVRIEVTGDLVRLEVADPGRGFEIPGRDRAVVGVSGWGLFLVDRLADRWGVEPGPTTRVWLEIDLPRRRSLRREGSSG
ncbi:MAG TPA: ATP-binding protein [Actinomycetota bacterium]|nr:ATP-binding protein [Actinomycetota bacterium]